MQSLGYMEYFQHQHQVLVKPLSTRKEEWNRPALRVQPAPPFSWGNPPLVCPPPLSDTPTPTSISIHSINLWGSESWVAKNSKRNNQKEPKNISILTEVSKVGIFTCNSKIPPPTPHPPRDKTHQSSILSKFKLSRGNCIKQDPDDITIDDLVGLLIPIQFCSTEIIPNGWTTTLLMHTYDFDLSDVHGKTINSGIIKLYRGINSVLYCFKP